MRWKSERIFWLFVGPPGGISRARSCDQAFSLDTSSMSYFTDPLNYDFDRARMYNAPPDVAPEPCTPAACSQQSLDAMGFVFCGTCKRKLCPDCSTQIGYEFYCQAHSVCGHMISTEETDAHLYNRTACKQPACAWCTECGDLLCSDHSAKLPDQDLCVRCSK